MNPLFESNQANDGEDLINFIIMTLHEELNKSKVDTNNYNNKNPTNEPLMLNDFLIRFSKENCSIISDIFYGAKHSIYRCSSCLKQTHNFDIFFFLSFPLEEVREYKLKLLNNQNNMMTNQNEANKFLNQNFVMNNMMNNQIFQQNMIKIQFLLINNQVNIYDCFDFIQKEENLTGKNSIFCNACKIFLPHTYASYLYSTPNILILVLKREKEKTGSKVKMEIYTEIDLTNYVQFKPNNEKIKYDLIGVVTKYDNNISFHFIATCKSPIDYNWYQYNDDLVISIKNLKTQVLDNAMPYILFYQKRV